MKKRTEIEKSIRQFFLYLLVGTGATFVEWIFFYGLNQILEVNYFLATTIAFLFSTFANWLLGKLLLFHKNLGTLQELFKVYLTSMAGLAMNLLIMWIAIDFMSADEMLAKIIATGIVFIWNFVVRKYFIYKI